MSNSAFYRGLEMAQQAMAGAPAAPAAAAHAVLSAHLESTADAGRRACRAGCSFCCHHPVGITWPEALRLLQAIDALPPEERTAIRADVAAAAAATKACSWSDLAALPCPLLRDGRCRAYDARPVPCRAWASFDAAACERAAAGPAAIPCDTEAFSLGLGASAALAGAAGGTEQAELRSALAAMFAAPAGAQTVLFAAFHTARAAGT